jgi:threonine/homoserine efflux transporter RhtA
MQSMRLMVYALLVFAASAFVAWTGVHTDEETFTLALILVLALALGLAFPKYAAVTIAMLALPVSIMETLANYGFVHAPYPTAPGISWAALVALVPAILGALAGVWMRNLFRRTPAAA